ncbi:MAG: UbiH/UbiF/VisC/COQ6 family ubiquinone biosynthesis hydroxylase [Halioglobus sp.]
MDDHKHYDVTIIGAGIAGSTLALLLSGKGLSIALVEAQPPGVESGKAKRGISGFDSRVSALTPNSRVLLEQIQVWQGITAQRVCAYQHMTVWDGDGTAVLEFDGDEMDVSALGYIAENAVVVGSLLDRVRASSDITFFNPRRLEQCDVLEAGTVEIALENGTQLTTDLLVAADGALSKVRQMLDFETREWDYGHRAIVATVQLELPHQSTAWQRFLSSGPLAFLPLPDVDGQHFCSIVWSLDEALVDPLLALDDQEFCRQLQEAFEGRLGNVEACSKRFAFPLRQRHAVEYVRSGVALVGDAAHTIHPLAGQGVNLGLQDVAVLAQEVLTAHSNGQNCGQLETLKRYQRRRLGENLAMMAAMDGFKRLFAQRSLPVRWLRNAGMRSVGNFAPLKRQLMRHAMGIGR